MSTATETATFSFDVDLVGTLSFEAPVGTDPEVVLEAIRYQLCLDNRLDLPEGVSLDFNGVERIAVEFAEQD